MRHNVSLIIDLFLQTIPQKFVQYFRGKITRNVKFESRNGSTFNVQLINDLGKLVLASGWEEFVTVHDLNMGNFLVFKYNGSSHLKVLIFDPSGCEKPSSVFMKRLLNPRPVNQLAWKDSIMILPWNFLQMKEKDNGQNGIIQNRGIIPSISVHRDLHMIHPVSTANLTN
jgi:hypothetical protein